MLYDYASEKDAKESCECGVCDWCVERLEYEKEKEIDRQVDLERN